MERIYEALRITERDAIKRNMKLIVLYTVLALIFTAFSTGGIRFGYLAITAILCIFIIITVWDCLRISKDIKRPANHSMWQHVKELGLYDEFCNTIDRELDNPDTVVHTTNNCRAWVTPGWLIILSRSGRGYSRKYYQHPVIRKRSELSRAYVTQHSTRSRSYEYLHLHFNDDSQSKYVLITYGNTLGEFLKILKQIMPHINFEVPNK